MVSKCATIMKELERRVGDRNSMTSRRKEILRIRKTLGIWYSQSLEEGICFFLMFCFVYECLFVCLLFMRQKGVQRTVRVSVCRHHLLSEL